MNAIVKDVLVSIASGLITALGTTIIIYFKFLKRIPTETKDKIDQLLNDRLGYETTNHNAVLQTINSESAELSHEHKDLSKENQEIKDIVSGQSGRIITAVGGIDHKLQRQEDRTQLLREGVDDHRAQIIGSIEKLSDFGKIYGDMLFENHKYDAELSEIRNDLQRINAEKAELSHNLDNLQNVNRRLMSELEKYSRSKPPKRPSRYKENDYDLEP